MHLLGRAVCGFALMGMMSVACANSSVSATLDAVKLTLIDLDPSDGVAPWISFQNGTDTFRGGVFVLSNDQVVDGGYASYTKPFLSFTRQASGGGNLARASFTADATGQGGQQTAQSYAVFQEVSRELAQAQAIAVSNKFQLSDKTLLVVTASSTLNMAVTHAWSTDAELNGEVADAFNRIQIYGPAAGGEGTGTQLSDALHEIHLRSQGSWNVETSRYDLSPDSRSESRSFSASFSNLSGSALSGTLFITSSAVSVTPGTPVPEPGAASLLLAGLLGIGFALRNRRR